MASRDSPGFFAQWGGMVQQLKTIPYGQKSGTLRKALAAARCELPQPPQPATC